MSTSTRTLDDLRPAATLPDLSRVLYPAAIVSTNVAVAGLTLALGSAWLSALLLGISLLMLAGTVSGQE